MSVRVFLFLVCLKTIAPQAQYATPLPSNLGLNWWSFAAVFDYSTYEIFVLGNRPSSGFKTTPLISRNGTDPFAPWNFDLSPCPHSFRSGGDKTSLYNTMRFVGIDDEQTENFFMYSPNGDGWKTYSVLQPLCQFYGSIFTSEFTTSVYVGGFSGTGDLFTDSFSVSTVRKQSAGNEVIFGSRMPTARAMMAADVDYDKYSFYVAGGTPNTNLTVALTTFEAYNYYYDWWATLPPLPVGRIGAAGLMLGSQFLVIGGVDSKGTVLSTIDVFDTNTQTWSTSSYKLNTPRVMASAVTVFVRELYLTAIYVLGGCTSPVSFQQNTMFLDCPKPTNTVEYILLDDQGRIA